MTLDEAIAHCLAKATEYAGTECGNSHRQLAEWLQELRQRRNDDVPNGGVWNERETGA